MNHTNKVLLICLTIVALFAACQKPTPIGADIFPDNIGSKIDTFDVITTTERADSLFTDNLSLYHLGLVNDPIFGSTFAEVYTQILLSENNVDFGTGAIADSIVLQIRFNGFFGSAVNTYDVNVYEIDDATFSNGDSYAKSTFNVNPTAIGSLSNYTPDYFSPVGTDSLSPHLRIPIDISVANNIVAQSGGSALEDDTSFTNFFNGMLITVDSTSTTSFGMMGLNFNSIISKVILYYQNSSEDSLTYEFDITNNGIKCNHFVNNHTGSIAENYINTITADDSLSFGQPFQGLVTKVKIPVLDTLKDVLINKAELITYRIKDVHGNMDTIPNPLRILAQGINDNGRRTISADEAYSFSNLNYRIGGAPDSVLINGQYLDEFKLNLTLHTQEIVNGGINNNGIYLSPFPLSTSPRRIVLAGGNHSKYKMRYFVRYTPIQ